MRAIIFGFNGVIADDETPHLHCFQRALAEAGLCLSKEEYYGTYLGMDERTCTAALLTTRDGSCDSASLAGIIERKAGLFREHTALHKPALFPWITGFVQRAAGPAGDRVRRPTGTDPCRTQRQHHRTGV